MSQYLPLKAKFQPKLDEPGIPSALDPPEIRSIGNVPVGLEKLGMIESIEELRQEFQVHSLRDWSHFLKSHFQLLIPGPQHTVRGALPMVPGGTVSSVKALGLNPKLPGPRGLSFLNGSAMFG